VNPKRGEVWWADLGEPRGNEPAYQRPVLVIQADDFNRSNLATVIVLSLTSNVGLQTMPGNVLLPASESGLPKDSVINVTQIATVSKADLAELVGHAPPLTMDQVEYGLGLVLGI
jgi:mRNA interferase MazF